MSLNALSDEIAKTIIDLGTELKSEKSDVTISFYIMRADLGTELKSEKSDVTISFYIMRADKPELNKRGIEVNHRLKEMYVRMNFFLIDPFKKINASHLNTSRLHLNRKGASILSSNFTQHIWKVFN